MLPVISWSKLHGDIQEKNFEKSNTKLPSNVLSRDNNTQKQSSGGDL